MGVVARVIGKKDVKVCILEPVLIYPRSTGGVGSHGDHRLRSKRASVANIRVKRICN